MNKKTLGMLFIGLFFISGVQAKVQPRIVGGAETYKTEHLFSVAIVLLSSRQKAVCTGSLIANKWVLSAAHCFAGTILSASNTGVVTGCTDIRSTACTTHTIRKVYYGKYNESTGDSDLALLELNQEVAGAYTIPLANSTPAARTVTYALGWGLLAEDVSEIDTISAQTTTKLNIVDLPIVSLQTCRDSGLGVTKNMVCAGNGQGGKDTCQGDSGGPLVTKTGVGYQLVGATSFGVGCARPGTYGAYVDISKYKTEIEKVITTGESPAFFDYYSSANASQEPIIPATRGGGGGGAIFPGSIAWLLLLFVGAIRRLQRSAHQ